jgi:glycine cleavage system H protein
VAATESYPADLKYHREHDWARIEGGEALFGITWKAQDMLGELVFFQPPAVGSTVAKDGAYGEVESVKAVSDLVAPLSGKVIAFNEKVQSEPETINADPYGEGWLVRVELSDPGEAEALLDAEAYKQLLVEE